MSDHVIEVRVNGQSYAQRVEARVSLCDFLRGDLGFTGVHSGCEHGVCGACTVIVDGRAVRSCLMLAVQSDGCSVTTVEGVASADGTLHPVQEAMRETYGLQCGFCTPGVVMTLYALTEEATGASLDTVLGALSGHLCRCTGYQGIRRAACRLLGEKPADVREGSHP